MGTNNAAIGYASDDECEPRQLPQGFGELLGDKPAKRKLSSAEVTEYGVRQSSSGPRKKPRFLEAVIGSGRPTPAQTKPRNSIEYHMALLSLLKKVKAPSMKSDFAILRENHRFLRDESDDDGSWEAALAKRYYDRLFKEYVICDLSGYRKGNVGFRWRTESEVVSGRGQFSCGHRSCQTKTNLKSYEVDFKYAEAGTKKRALVKVRLCQDCAFKLHYKRLKAERKRRCALEKGKKGLASSCSPEVVAKDEIETEVESKEDAQEKRFPKESVDETSDDDDGPPGESERKLLESLAWRGPDPEARTREDDFDDYLQNLFL